MEATAAARTTTDSVRAMSLLPAAASTSHVSAAQRPSNRSIRRQVGVTAMHAEASSMPFRGELEPDDAVVGRLQDVHRDRMNALRRMLVRIAHSHVHQAPEASRARDSPRDVGPGYPTGARVLQSAVRNHDVVPVRLERSYEAEPL